VPGAEAAIDLDEDQAEAMAALAALDDEQREVVVLEQLADLALTPTAGRRGGVPDLDPLRELTRQVQPPAFGTLVDVARRRRTRITWAVLGGVGLCLLVLATGLLPRSEDDPAPESAEETSWTPGRIRNHPEALAEPPAYADARRKDVAARVWMVCTARCDDWDRATARGRGDYSRTFKIRWTVEVTRNSFATSVLVPEFGAPGRVSFWRDDLFVVTQPEAGGGCCEESHHLVSAEGEVADLATVEPAEPRPQPGITLVEGKLVVIDLDAGTFAEVALPFIAGAVEWAPNPSTWLWGLSGHSNPAGDRQTFDAVWQEPQGYFRQHRLAVGPVHVEVEPLDEVGRMAFTEEHWDTGQLAVHLSEDRGRTWQRIVVSSRREIRELLR
jgi:hypothetical protein